jgi:hypothetical protein
MYIKDKRMLVFYIVFDILWTGGGFLIKFYSFFWGGEKGFRELQYIEKRGDGLTACLEPSFQHDRCANPEVCFRNIGDRIELHILGILKVHETLSC